MLWLQVNIFHWTKQWKNMGILQQGQLRAISMTVAEEPDVQGKDEKLGFILPREKKAQWSILLLSSAT